MAAKRSSPQLEASLKKKVKLEEQGSAGCAAGGGGYEVGSTEHFWESAIQAALSSQAEALAKDFSLAPAKEIKQEKEEEVEFQEQNILAPEITSFSESNQSDATKRQLFRPIKQEGHGGRTASEASTSHFQATHHTQRLPRPTQQIVESFRPQEDMVLPSTAVATCQEVPWCDFKDAVTFVCQKGGNVIVRCNFCLPVVKNISSAISSSSSVQLHLKKAHPEQLRAILSAAEARRSETSHDLPPIKLPKHQQPKQVTLERWGFGKEAVTQTVLDRKIMDFIVGEALPLDTVDKPLFVQLVHLGLPKGLTIMCARTLRDRIEKRAADIQETLMRQMGAVAYVATTADCWTDGKKRFLGVTACWINPLTLNHEFGALACRRLKGQLTRSVLAKALFEVYEQYGIQNKVVCTTTDNGSNFAKVFCRLKAEEPVDAADTSPDSDCDVQEKAEVEFLCISEILDTVNKADEGAEVFRLPPHHRCISHTLTLVATLDVEAMITNASENSALGPFKEHFCDLMEKCHQMWQSTQFAAYLYKQCRVSLKVPNKTRWNSTFEARKQLSELLSSMPLRVGAILYQCSLDQIANSERQVIQGYAEIMNLLFQTLENILQGKSGMFMGHLLPTLYKLDHGLEGLESKLEKLTYCSTLLWSVRSVLRERFASVWGNKKLILAACLHPQFKLDWLESAQLNRDMMEALLKSETENPVTKLDSDNFSENSQKGESFGNDIFSFKSRSPESAVETCDKEVLRDLMEALLKSEVQQTLIEVDSQWFSENHHQEGGGSSENGAFSSRSWGKKPAVEMAHEEVLRYLKCPSREVSSLQAFPRIRQCFLQYNTGIPSSAAAEHLFGAEGKSMTPNRHDFSDELWEQLFLLRQNGALC